MSWVSSMFGGGSSYKNPADEAMPYLEEIPGYVDQYYNPYIENGLNAGATNMQQYGQMASDPTGYYNDIYGDYEQSDYSKYQSDQMHEAQQNSSAAGGFTGTDSDQQKQAELENALLSMDWDKYLQSVMGIQNTGLQGNQQMYNTGYGASNSAANAMIGNANAQAGLAYNSTSQENAYNQANQNSLMNILGDTAGIVAGLYGMPSLGGSGSSSKSYIPSISSVWD